MRRRWFHSVPWLVPALVAGSTLLPALHRAAHHGEAVTAAVVWQADVACALCAGVLAAGVPSPPALEPLGARVHAPAPPPRVEGRRRAVPGRSRAPPMG